MTAPAAEVRSFAVTIPAGTALDSPATTAVTFPPRLVEGVHWKVPPGPSGTMGWRLTMSGGIPVIPAGGGWIIADNDSDTWPLIDQPDSGAWEVTGYNTDIYDHTVYLDFLLGVIGQAAPGAGAQVTLVSVPAGVTVPPVTVPPVSIPGVTVPPVTVPPPVPVSQPALVTVPATRGDRVGDAIARLTAAGLGHRTVPARDPRLQYAVRAQSPPGGRLVPAGTVVTLDVTEAGGR